jgi:hypothetical protein
MRIVPLVFALGCGGSTASTTPKNPNNDAVTCAAVANAMVGMMMEGKNQENAAETADGFNAIIRTRCDADAWTPEARQCLATMKTRSDAERCSAMLTEEQQSNLVRDQKEKFGAPPEQAPASTTAAPPPQGAPPASPMRAEPPKEAPKSAPKGGKTKKAGDPCDGGE